MTTKYLQLVNNGCSYSALYANGNGHTDLANQLGIPTSMSLAIPGSANSRIIRTTLKHSFNTNVPTFYLIGLTFISRDEVPVLTVDHDDTFEGRWTNPQNQKQETQWQHNWTENESKTFVNLKEKYEVYSLVDRAEHLMYLTMSMVESLQSRGHTVLIFQQAEEFTWDHPKFNLLKNKKNIINEFKWKAIHWQHDQGVLPEIGNFLPNKWTQTTVPEHIKHREPGHHQKLNEFLINYIKEYKILE